MDIPRKVIQHVLFLISGQLPVRVGPDKPTRGDSYKQDHRGPWSSDPWMEWEINPARKKRGSQVVRGLRVGATTRMTVGEAARIALYHWRGKNIEETELIEAIVDITRAVDGLRREKRNVTRRKATRDALFEGHLAKNRRARVRSDAIIRRARLIAGRLLDDCPPPLDMPQIMNRAQTRWYPAAARNGVTQGGPFYAGAERQWYSSETAYDQAQEMRRTFLIEKRIWFCQIMLARLGRSFAP